MKAEVAHRHLRRIAGRHHQRQRTVRRSAADHLLRDRTGALRVVLDRDRLAEALGKLFADKPTDDVGASARRGTDQNADRPRRPVLRDRRQY
jgi:hypothetical protein